MTAIDAAMTPLERRRRSRGDRIAVHAAAEAVQDAGLLECAVTPRASAFFSVPVPAICCATRITTAPGSRRPRSRAPVGCLESFPQHAGRCHCRALRLRRAARLHRRRLFVEHDRDRPGGGSHPRGTRRRGARRRRRRPCPADVQRVQPAPPDGSGAVPAVRSQPRRHEHRRRRRILVLEDPDRARRRGAHIYAELAGHGLACEAFHPTAPEPDGRAGRRCDRRAPATRGPRRDDVDHINAHGTATPQNDAAEAAGFSTRVRRSRRPITGDLDQVDGRTLPRRGRRRRSRRAGALGRRGVIPPTIHHGETDRGLRDRRGGQHRARQRLRCGVSTSLGFGGNDSAIVMRAVLSLLLVRIQETEVRSSPLCVFSVSWIL